MPADNLLAAMIAGSGGGNGALLTDPALLEAQPEIQFGSGLMQQAGSTAPAYPAQALARALSGAIGAGLTHSAVSDLAKAYAGSAQGMADIFHAGTPIGDALRSPNPMVRMAALQQAPKALLLNSERFGVHPGEESHAMGNPMPTTVSGQPQSPEGKVVHDALSAARAGNVPAANALGSSITKEISTPSGVQFPPTNVTPDVARGAGTTPASAIQPPENTPHAQTPAQMPEAIGQAQAKQEAAKELYAKAADAAGGQIAEYINAGGKGAHDRINALDAIDDALKVGDKGIMTGPLAEKVLRAKEALNGMGIDVSWVHEGLPMAEVAQKMNAQLSAASSRSMTARPTQFEFVSWMKNNPGLLNSKEGTHALIDILKQTANQDIGLGNLGTNRKNWENWGDVVDKYYKEHPLISPFTHKPMAQDNAQAKAATPEIRYNSAGQAFVKGPDGKPTPYNP